jgi:hypothetical protein
MPILAVMMNHIARLDGSILPIAMSGDIKRGVVIPLAI